MLSEKRRVEVTLWLSVASSSSDSFQNGTLRKHVEYDSFGDILGEEFFNELGAPIAATHAEAIDQLFHYTGREWDRDAQLQNNRGRWYNPTTGRFASEDPIAFDAGDPNLYRYVGNSPLNATDPTGLFTVKPLDYLPALNDPVFTYSTGVSATDFRSYDVSRTARPLSVPTSEPRMQRNLTDQSLPYQGPINTPDLSQEVFKLSHLPKGSYTTTKTDDFGQTLIHARTPNGQTYAFDPETGVRDTRMLQRLSDGSDYYEVFVQPGWRTEFVNGPGTFSLAIEGAASAVGFFGAGAVARPAAQVVKNLAVNAYETVLESYLPGIGLFKGRPRARDLDVLPAPNNAPRFDTNHPLIEGVLDRPRSAGHAFLQQALADEAQASGFYQRISRGSINLSEFSGLKHGPDIKPDFMGLTPDGKIDMIEVLSPGQRKSALERKLRDGMEQLPPHMRGEYGVIDPNDAFQ
jgi:RHS repeat-associated protein